MKRQKEFNGLLKSEITKAIKMASILYGKDASDLYIAETSDEPALGSFWDVKATIRSYSDKDVSIVMHVSCYLSNRRHSYAYDITNTYMLTSDDMDGVRAYAKAKFRDEADRKAYVDKLVAKAKKDIVNTIKPIYIDGKAYISKVELNRARWSAIDAITLDPKLYTMTDESIAIYDALIAYNLEDTDITVMDDADLVKLEDRAQQAEDIIASAQEDMQEAVKIATDVKSCEDARQKVLDVYKAGKLALIKTCGNAHAGMYIKRLRESRRDVFKALSELETDMYADMAISATKGEGEGEGEVFESEMVSALKHKMISVLADMADDHRYGDMPIDDMCTYVDDTLEWSESHALLDRDEISYLKEALGEHIAHTYIAVEKEM